METLPGIKVLLIEDDEHDRAVFERVLRNHAAGWEVTSVRRAEKALNLVGAGKNGFDVVVVDYDLPGMNGLSFFKALLSDNSEHLPPFVMLTGAGTEELAVEALKSGIYDYIVKDGYQGYVKLIPLILKSVISRHQDHQHRLESQIRLENAHRQLERKVEERTEALALSVKALQDEIKERKQIEKALRRSEGRLRDMSRKILDVQEKERNQAAREIHDALGGNLSMLKFALEEKLEHMVDSPPTDQMPLEKVIDLVEETIREMRRICASLRPAMLDDLGLVKTLDWFCREFEKYYPHIQLTRRFDMNETELDPSLQSVVYRIMQEALNNAAKHSGAESITVDLKRRRKGIELCVTDNGCGFDAEEVEARSDALRGNGLTGMRDRAVICGGWLEISSSASGTMLTLTLPGKLDPGGWEHPASSDSADQRSFT